jgi:FkbM family methyltransferase
VVSKAKGVWDKLFGRSRPELPSLDGASLADAPATALDVVYSYRLFLQRNPDPIGFGAYADQISRGTTVRDLVSYFVGCPEWVAQGFFKTPGNTAYARAETADFPLYVLDADPVVAREILSTGAYEPHVTRCLRETLHPGDVFVDIGANIGHHAILAARCVGPEGRVFAFEPSSVNVKALALNKILNQADHLTIYPFALSDTEGLLSLMKIVSIASTRALEAPDLEYLNDVDVVYATRLDALLSSTPRVDVIKCDIDGHDYRAMKGATGLIERFRPVIVAELNPNTLPGCSGCDADEYMRFLLGFGYSMSVLLRTGETISCGSDPAAVTRIVRERALDQVDLFLQPT